MKKSNSAKDSKFQSTTQPFRAKVQTELKIPTSEMAEKFQWKYFYYGSFSPLLWRLPHHPAAEVA
jgi:hypothetical protein